MTQGTGPVGDANATGPSTRLRFGGSVSAVQGIRRPLGGIDVPSGPRTSRPPSAVEVICGQRMNDNWQCNDATMLRSWLACRLKHAKPALRTDVAYLVTGEFGGPACGSLSGWRTVGSASRLIGRTALRATLLGTSRRRAIRQGQHRVRELVRGVNVQTAAFDVADGPHGRNGCRNIPTNSGRRSAESCTPRASSSRVPQWSSRTLKWCAT